MANNVFPLVSANLQLVVFAGTGVSTTPSSATFAFGAFCTSIILWPEKEASALSLSKIMRCFAPIGWRVAFLYAMLLRITNVIQIFEWGRHEPP